MRRATAPFHVSFRPCGEGFEPGLGLGEPTGPGGGPIGGSGQRWPEYGESWLEVATCMACVRLGFLVGVDRFSWIGLTGSVGPGRKVPLEDFDEYRHCRHPITEPRSK
ncbi:hypothetical protein F511_23980 [Dorcoceras hygrometricum]|uniref:Uncharacterized protein n=1 Tax=Dorcoceras hygrometricum TaxID=472368 RepID=A0A2Z7CZF0_9LAMI|nr:hypothetical protein F511_23980 [Dorcoceras hygrometricum]